MASRNQFIITGNVSQPPRMLGKKCILPVATNNRYFDKKTNDWKETTDFLTLQTWSEKKAAFLMKSAQVGDHVTADGRIQASSYDKGDEKVYTTDLIIGEIDIHPKASKPASPDDSN